MFQKKWLLPIVFVVFFACGAEQNSNSNTTESTSDEAIEPSSSNDLEATLADPEKVTELILQGKNLKEIPEGLKEFKNLKTLYFEGNPEVDFDVLVSYLAELPNLQELSLAENNLKQLPEGLTKLEKLHSIWLDVNPELDFQQAFSVLKNIPALEELFLNDNQLKNLPENISEIQQLKHLHLNYNPIKTFPNTITNLENLELIALIGMENLDFNAACETMSKMKLKRLLLSNNQLPAIPVQLTGMQSLEILWLDNNLITAIPDTLAVMQNLKIIHVAGNPLEDGEFEKLKGMFPNAEVQ